MFHKTLYRQLIKVFGSEGKIPKDLNPLFQVISDTYLHADEDRALTVRSLEISSRELENLNIQLQSEGEIIEKEVEKRTQELSAERNKLSLILSGIVDAVIAVDLQKRIILFNKAAENLTGYRTVEVMYKPIDEVIKLFDNVTQISSETFCPMPQNNFEGIIYNKRGLKIFGLNQKQAYVDLLTGQIKEGSVSNLGCILTLHDVSKEMQLEEMKLDFVSMSVHELRTPLTSVTSYLYIFLRDYAKSMDAKQISILSRINIATQRLVSLVENLLNVSRIEKGTLTLSLLSLDWIKNIDEEIAEMIDQANDKKITLEFIKPQQSFIVIADKFRINEVLSNLLANAVAYTSAGGKITVWLERKGNEVITHIQDTGAGIPKDALPHLFTKFFRVSGSLEQGSKGTGLGLYIAKSVVQLHKGKIWVNSEFGRGSTFSFSLPCTNS